ncbi:hypothetical protein [Undibacterium sp. WLHG33]|uniref:hypothetical protein n=1 Tax=Undibacterium sp. WLHG33 TaxID=3412482 RepID=UPI003C2B55A9
MGAIVVFLIGGLVSVVIAIYQFINAVYAGLGYLMGLQLASFSGDLVKSSAIFSPKYETYALPALGVLFCITALVLLGGFRKWVLIALSISTVLLSLIGLAFGQEPVRFLIGLAFFIMMPFVLKKLTFSIILWRDDDDDWVGCLINTILLGIVSGPAVIIAFTEIFVFIDGSRKAAEGYVTYILAPLLYSLLLFANLKRNKVV